MSTNQTEILTVEEVAEILYVGRNTVYGLLKSGEISGFQIGRIWKIPMESVREYITEKCLNKVTK